MKIIGMTVGKVLKRSGTLSGADQTVADFDVYRREQANRAAGTGEADNETDRTV